MFRGTRGVVSSIGFDENLQVTGADAYSSPYNVGLRIPSGATADNQHRYLFMLCRASFNARQRARLVDFRQLLTIGAPVSNGLSGNAQANYIYEIPITTPYWHFQDGSVSWHILRMRPELASGGSGKNVTGVKPGGQSSQQDGCMFRDSRSPALLFESYTSYNGGGTNIGGYTPPYAGNPMLMAGAEPLAHDLGGFHDIRRPWQTTGTAELDMEFEGPCDIAFYASVRQTTTSTRTLFVPGSLPAGSNQLGF